MVAISALPEYAALYITSASSAVFTPLSCTIPMNFLPVQFQPSPHTHSELPCHVYHILYDAKMSLIPSGRTCLPDKIRSLNALALTLLSVVLVYFVLPYFDTILKLFFHL